MHRRALLGSLGVALASGFAGCGGSDGDTDTTGTTTTATTTGTTTATADDGTPTSTAPLIDASMAALKLRADELPSDENWTFQREDDNTTRFELDNNQNLTGYVLAASVLAHTDFESGLAAFEDARDRANAYTGITVQRLDIGDAAFGYQLTEDTGTVVFRAVNVVGELEYTLEYDSTGDHAVSLGTVAEYATLWLETWRN